MFDVSYWIEDYGCHTIYNATAKEAAEYAEKNDEYESLHIETSCLGTTVFSDGKWLYPIADAIRIANEELGIEAEAENAKEIERATEAATVGDEFDKANIAFIMSIANKYPARDNGARRAAEEIGRNIEWRNKRDSWKPTEGDVVHLPSGREYHIDMWKGARKITRTLLK